MSPASKDLFALEKRRVRYRKPGSSGVAASKTAFDSLMLYVPSTEAFYLF